jgi:FMN-dependent NADH-azoreductase
MSKFLFVHSSARGSASASRELAEHFKSGLIAKGAEVKEVDLAKEAPPVLDEQMLGAFFTPSGDQTAQQADTLKTSERFIDELRETDTLVISAGMYNFSVPSTLKAYIDQILRAGRTFQYTDTGPQGLINGKKAVLILSTGGVYSKGPMLAMDFLTPYLKAVLGFIGITDVEVVLAEGLAFGNEAAVQAMTSAKGQLDSLAA